MKMQEAALLRRVATAETASAGYVYLDWLTERGREQDAERIRLQLASEASPEPLLDHLARAQQLLPELVAPPEFRGLQLRLLYRGGLPDELRLRCATALPSAVLSGSLRALAEGAPTVRRIQLRASTALPPGALEALRDFAGLRQLHLNLEGGPDSSTLELLGALPLDSLSLANSSVDELGLAALAQSPLASRLRQLELARTPVASGALIGRFRALEALSISEMTGVTPFSALKQLPLTTLISSRPLTDASLPQLASLVDLRRLELGGVDANAATLASWSPPPLRALMLNRASGLGDSAMGGLGRACTLRSLGIDHPGDVSPAGLASLADLERLRALYLFGPHLTDDHVEAIARACQGLESLTIVGGPQLGSRSLAAIATMPHLRRLGLRFTGGSCRVEAAAVGLLARAPELRTLVINAGLASDEALVQLPALPALQRLVINDGERVGDPGLRAIAEIPKLGSLQLSHCPRLTNLGLSYLAAAAGLRHLALDDCPNVTPAGKDSVREALAPLLLEAPEPASPWAAQLALDWDTPHRVWTS